MAKAAAGALEHLPVVRVGNVNRALEDLKERRILDLRPGRTRRRSYDEMDYGSPTVFVLGGEGKGLHQLVRETLRHAGADPDGGQDSVVECVGRGRHRSFRVETAQWR